MRGELASLVEATRIHRRQERDMQVITRLRTTLSTRAGMLRWLDARPPDMSEENVPMRTEAQLFAYLNWRRGGHSPSQVLRLMILPPVDERYRRIQGAFPPWQCAQFPSRGTVPCQASLERDGQGAVPGLAAIAAIARLLLFLCPARANAAAAALGPGSHPAWQKAVPARMSQGADKKDGGRIPAPDTGSRPGPGPGGAAPSDPRDEAFAYWAARLRASLRSAIAQITGDSFLLFDFINPHSPTASIWAVADSDESGACLHIVGGGLVRLHDAPAESDKLLWVVAMLMMFSLTNSMSYWLLDFQSPPDADVKRRRPRRRRRAKGVNWGYVYTREFDPEPDLIPEAEPD